MDFNIQMDEVESRSIETKSVLAQELTDLQLTLVGGGNAGVIIA